VFRPLDWAACSVVVGLVLTPAPARAQAAGAVDPTSTLSGVYTQEQAKRGKEVYLNLCKSCHIPSTGESFARRWGGKTLLDLFNYIYEMMPDNNPRTLDEPSDADVIAYLMQSTGMPVGTREIPIAADSLKAIRIDVKKEGASTGHSPNQARRLHANPASPRSTR
jgi:hypothetical protein